MPEIVAALNKAIHDILTPESDAKDADEVYQVGLSLIPLTFRK